MSSTPVPSWATGDSCGDPRADPTAQPHPATPYGSYEANATLSGCRAREAPSVNTPGASHSRRLLLREATTEIPPSVPQHEEQQQQQERSTIPSDCEWLEHLQLPAVVSSSPPSSHAAAAFSTTSLNRVVSHTAHEGQRLLSSAALRLSPKKIGSAIASSLLTRRRRSTELGSDDEEETTVIGSSSASCTASRGASQHKASKKAKKTGLDNRGTLMPLPATLMHRVFELLLRFDGTLRPIPVLTRVSKYWHDLVEHSVMWEIVAKQYLVAYPLLRRLVKSAPVDVEEEAIVQRVVRPPLVASLLVRGGDGRHTPSLSPTLRCATSPEATMTPPLHPTGRSGTSVSEQRVNTETLSLIAPRSAGPLGGSRLPGTDDEDAYWMEPPSRVNVRKSHLGVRKYIASRRYHELVQRRRTFVLHTFFSLSLLCFSMCLLTAMCGAEGLDPITVCNSDTSFHFLWLTYLSVFGAVISNIVMETHFEPQPLIRRVRMHTELIRVSAAALLLGFVFLGIPTLLVQWNLRQYFMPWLVCFSPVLVALVCWQAEVLYSVRQDIIEFTRRPYFNFGTMYHGFSYSTPTLFIIAVCCIAEYIENRPSTDPFLRWLLLVVGSLPGGLALFTLTIVFLLDYNLKHQESDLIAGAMLGVMNLCPVLIVTQPEFRGYTILPLVVASFGFFAGHLNDLRRRVELAVFDPDGERVLYDED